jgi:hypothetical protein
MVTFPITTLAAADKEKPAGLFGPAGFLLVAGRAPRCGDYW